MTKRTEPTRWDDLRVFLAVLRAGSFSGAAEALGIEQSTVSRRVASLEAELGQPLFDRTPLGPKPSALAERMRVHAERLGSEVQAIADLAAGDSNEVEGRVRLAMSESFAVHVFIPHLYPELRRRHPLLAVDVLCSTGSADLGRREADLAIRFYRPLHGDLITQRMACLPTSVLAKRAYAEARPADPEQLDWIVLELAEGQSGDAAYVAEHIKRPPSMFTNSHLTQVEAVRTGVGVAVLARAHLAIDPQLTALSLDLPPSAPIEVWLAAPRGLRPTARISAVWDYLAECLRLLEQV
ncbi:MAG TPA: LysR family transcriptional regulator [Polyangiales bacterium]|nr:LysR family transcriptional regulator [Polyangiales bacterium]